jgi:signal transduction histidine kinase
VSTIARDIGDRQRAEAAERDAASLRSVASLATAAAHEISSPLTVIVGALELLQQRASDPRVYEQLQRALDAAFAIRDITRRMKHVTRLETHALSSSPELPEMLDLQASSNPVDP